jgi:hypothetical protein
MMVEPVGSPTWRTLVRDILVEQGSQMNNDVVVHDGQAWWNEDYSTSQTLTYESDKAQNIRQAIQEAVYDNGATHISGSLLLHRYPELKQQLDGQSLRSVVQDMTALNDDILVESSHDGTDLVIVYHTAAAAAATTTTTTTMSSTGTARRLQVDEAGLFSVMA